MAIKGEARVQYASLVIEGKYPKFEMRIPLVLFFTITFGTITASLGKDRIYRE